MATAHSLAVIRAGRRTAGWLRTKNLASLGVAIVLTATAAASAGEIPHADADADRRFVAYFGHGQSAITPEARDLIRQASAYQRSTGGQVRITGHADRVGATLYNVRLSRKRARAVGGLLVKYGVPARAMTLRWSGETAVPHRTANEMHEPLNRCVIISVTT